MSNLEKLSLYFVYNERIIDGDELKRNILNHMTRLNKFTFDICSIIRRANQINIPSNEDIQYTFRNFKNNQTISCVNYFPEANECHCHIYSYPYTLTYYNNITNNFPGGLFKCVRKVSLYDECPFEHEFFLQIAQSFPFMEKLTVHNRKSQKNDNQQWSTIECLHLTELDLVRTHENYVEEFLINSKTRLLNNVTLHITYESLQRVTHNFTRDATRINCSKIDYIVLYSKPEFFQYSKDYFPNAEIV
jgi:hypothetical protein